MKLVLLSDPHVGASSGILPPDFISFEGNEIKQNPYQKWLWKCWLDCWKWAKKVIGDDEWMCAINGDLIDGNHHNTREIISPDVNDHINGCVKLFVDVLADAKKVYISEGTNVHTQNSEHGIAATLRHLGINIESPNKRKAAWSSMDIVVHGCRVAINHHVSASLSSLSESAAYSRTIGDVVNRRQRAGWHVPKVIVRSHRHQYGMFDDGYKKMIVLPPWQGVTRFTNRVVPTAVPQCGMVILDWSHAPYAETPTVHTRIHTVKQNPAIYL